MVAIFAAVSAVSAGAAGPPIVVESWVTDVTATSVNLRAKLNPNELSSTYRFEYVTEAAFQKSGFTTAAKAPPSGKGALGAGAATLTVVQQVGGLSPATVYRYRVAATNSGGTTFGAERLFSTQASSLAFRLPDDRAWEMVSPVDKGGGAIAYPESLFGGGAFQAAAGGAAVAYSSGTAFGQAQGAPPASQYVSRRTSAGWATENISPAIESAAYGDEPDGAPYRLFSADLARGLFFGGLPCRGALPGCPAPNPVLPGTGAPSGHMAYYTREDSTDAFASLLTAANLAHTAVGPEAFEVSFAAASPSLSHIALSSCAALTADATEIPDGPGKCDGGEQNLYLRSSSGLKLVNLLPAQVTGAPGAEVAASIGAVSNDGSRVYWAHGGNLYLRQGSQTFQVDESLGGGGVFETASADGSVAFLSKGGHLYRFIAATKIATDLTPSGGVTGVLGASADGSRVYYQDGTALRSWQSGTTTTVAPGASAAAPSSFPPSTGTARVTPDGEHLAFLSTLELTPFDNAGETEAYIYGPPVSGGAATLTCASCNPTGERPQGSASIPGALANGSTHAYRPRSLSDDGSRLFFESDDELVIHDTNSAPDVYQWEADGAGDCDVEIGCVDLISSGRSIEGAGFVDASADGADAYFVTEESLVPSDPEPTSSVVPGSNDLYDARVGGGFPVPSKPIPCIGDACQSLPAPPDDPTPGTLTKNAGNPPQRFFKEKAKAKGKGKGKRRGKGKRKGRGARGGRRG